MEVNDPCIFCGMDPCECAPKKAKKPKPKRKKSPPPLATTQEEAATKARPSKPAAKPEVKKKAVARPERDERNLVSNEARNRQAESESFWGAMRNLVNEGMVHEISVKRALDAYPSIPKGLY